MKTQKPFFIDVEKATRMGVISRCHIYCNGEKLPYAFSARSGKNGYAMIFDNRKAKAKYRHFGDAPMKKIRGNIHIKISPKAKQ